MLQKVRWGSFIRRTALALLVVGLLYGLVVVLPRYIKYHRRTPAQELTSLKVAVQANFLAFEGLSGIQEANKSSTEQLFGLRSQLGQSLNDLQAKIDRPSAKIAASFYADAQKIVTSENNLLTEYDDRYKEFAKVIQYNPSYDLGISIAEQKDKLNTRVQAASDALTQLSKRQDERRSEALQIQLADNATCFNNLAAQLSQNRDNEAKATMGQCLNLYEKLRAQAVQFIIGAFPAKDMEKILTDLKTLHGQMEKTLTNSS